MKLLKKTGMNKMLAIVTILMMAIGYWSCTDCC